VIDREIMPTSFEEASAALSAAVQSCTTVAMQAGHFMLYYDTVEDQLLGCVASFLSSPRHALLLKSMGGFPVESWKLGLRLLSALPCADKSILVLVNDWQYCPGNVDRSRFYAHHGGLPAEYAEVLSNQGSSPVRLLTPAKRQGARDTGPFFSEQALRNQYRRQLEELIELGRLPEGLVLEQNEGALTCSMVDLLGRKEAIYCSNQGANCTAEVAELLQQAHTLSRCDVFINLFPAVCREYVLAGTELGLRLFSPGITRVINLALPATDIEQENDLWSTARLTIHRF
jgi:hypothetical protein